MPVLLWVPSFAASCPAMQLSSDCLWPGQSFSCDYRCARFGHWRLGFFWSLEPGAWNFSVVSKKSAKIAELIKQHEGKTMPAHYLGYFECFNRELFYEAHDVLEELWLPERHRPNGLFFQGLIQLAGAFVHLQKGRLRPAGALFEKARINLSKYPASHFGTNVHEALQLIDNWARKLSASEYSVNPLQSNNAPKLALPT